MPAALLALLAAGAAAYAARRSGDPKMVFFSFHYADIWQVNQVKNSWVTQPSLRAAGFFDYSLAEAAKTRGAAQVRRLIDNALEGTEVTVVLIGSRTHSRKWKMGALRGRTERTPWEWTSRHRHQRSTKSPRRDGKAGREPVLALRAGRGNWRHARRVRARIRLGTRGRLQELQGLGSHSADAPRSPS